MTPALSSTRTYSVRILRTFAALCAEFVLPASLAPQAGSPAPCFTYPCEQPVCSGLEGVYLNASTSSFASRKSRVSNPSVNQS